MKFSLIQYVCFYCSSLRVKVLYRIRLGTEPENLEIFLLYKYYII